MVGIDQELSMSLILHIVTYKIGLQGIYPLTWRKEFFYEEEAKLFKESLEPDIFIGFTQRDTKSVIHTEAICSNPYRYLSGTYINLGDYRDSRGSYTSTGYTTKELYEAALIQHEARLKLELGHMNSYYSQPWV
jgi:hypothetical protein